MIPVIIVEDEFLVRVGLRSTVNWEDFGFTVVGDASSGEEALRLYEKHQPHVVITDIRMTPMDGLELMERIRRIDESVRFIIISAYDDFAYAQKAISLGADLYLDKANFTNVEIEQTLTKIKKDYDRQPPDGAAGYRPPEQIAELLGSLPDAPRDTQTWLEEQGFSSAPVHIAAFRHCQALEDKKGRKLLTTILEDTLQQGGVHFVTYYYKQYVVTLVQGQRPDVALQLLDKTVTTIEKYIGTPVFYGASLVTADTSVRSALKKAEAQCNQKIYDYSRRQYPALSDQRPIKEGQVAIDEISLLLQGGRRRQALDLISRLLSSEENYQQAERNYLSLTIALEGLDPSIDASDTLYLIMQTDSLGDIYQIFSRLVEQLELESVPESNPYVRDTIQYISEHLQEDLSVKALAARLYISPNYLGQLFYEQTGAYLSGYVTTARMNAAAQLLRTSQHSVATISWMVGMDNAYYFSRLFKETMGVSPQQYRDGKG